MAEKDPVSSLEMTVLALEMTVLALEMTPKWRSSPGMAEKDPFFSLEMLYLPSKTPKKTLFLA